MFCYLPYRKSNYLKNIKILILTEDWKTALAYKIPSRYSYRGETKYYEIEGYLEMYEKIIGKSIKSKSIDDLIDIALSEWESRNSS
ncbi:hypothetical protein [Okeania sp.]|uniref:hypothetical protein n=1 Tax=Okeania sp. TaxID=3100323 RepID=UPI002B4B8089|nr:hypothetical protein [Okeania sp.]MEB3342563.1 hypothetical protein [Okeania sp.]